MCTSDGSQEVHDHCVRSTLRVTFIRISYDPKNLGAISVPRPPNDSTSYHLAKRTIPIVWMQQRTWPEIFTLLFRHHTHHDVMKMKMKTNQLEQSDQFY